MKGRQVLPELLDDLPPDDPAAIKSRCDLRLINFFMGNHRWLRRSLRLSGYLEPGVKLVEIGAGDGLFGKDLAQRFPGLDYRALDLAPRPPNWPDNYAWQQGDVLENLGGGDVLIANLFLHHLEDDQLASLGNRLEGFRAVFSCEPARYHYCHWFGASLRLFGINHITRHDMHVSINAGFVLNELPVALGLSSCRGWEFAVQHGVFGSYRLRAKRDQPA